MSFPDTGTALPKIFTTKMSIKRADPDTLIECDGDSLQNIQNPFDLQLSSVDPSYQARQELDTLNRLKLLQLTKEAYNTTHVCYPFCCWVGDHYVAELADFVRTA